MRFRAGIEGGFKAMRRCTLKTCPLMLRAGGCVRGESARSRQGLCFARHKFPLALLHKKSQIRGCTRRADVAILSCLWRQAMLVLFVIVGLQQVAHADEIKAAIEATPRTATIDRTEFVHKIAPS